MSYGYIVIAALLIFGGMTASIFIIPFNQIFTVYNTFISQGMVTQQNADAMTFQRYLILALPIIIVLGVFAWGIVRALEKKWEGVQ